IAHDDLGVAAGVSLGVVKEVHARRVGRLHARARNLLADLAAIRHPRAQRERAELEASLAQTTIFHVVCSFSSSPLPGGVNKEVGRVAQKGHPEGTRTPCELPSHGCGGCWWAANRPPAPPAPPNIKLRGYGYPLFVDMIADIEPSAAACSTTRRHTRSILSLSRGSSLHHMHGRRRSNEAARAGRGYQQIFGMSD